MILLANVIKSGYVNLGESYELDPEIFKPSLEIAETDERETEAMAFSRQLIMEARQQAGRIKQEALDSAHKTLTAAAQERERLLAEAEKSARERGYAEGYDAGYAKGYKEARESQREIATALTEAFSALENEWERHLSESLDDLKYLALEVAEKIVGREIAADRDIYFGMIDEALRAFRDYDWVDVCFSAEDEELAARVEKKLAERVTAGNKFVKIRLLKELPPAACIVETNAGAVDVSPGVQLHQISRLLEEQVS
jgi:flagellar biosynthesis/type III secretory pathway protein FliH